MSNLKKDIAKLKICHFCAGIGYCEHKKQVVHDIFNLIESVIPEEKKDDIPGVIFNQAGIAYFDGWNECIADIKSKLIDGEKK